MSKKYSQEIKEKARRLVKEDKTIREIAEELNVNQANVRYWVRDLKVQKISKKKQKLLQEVKKLFKEGLSKSEISKKLNLKYQTVYSWLKDVSSPHGKSVNKRNSKEVIQKALCMRKEGQKVSNISKELNVSIPTLYSWFKKYKLTLKNPKPSANIVVENNTDLDDDEFLDKNFEKFEKSLLLTIKIKEKSKHVETFDFWDALRRSYSGDRDPRLDHRWKQVDGRRSSVVSRQE